MSLSLYLTCGVIGLLGLLVSVLMQMKSQSNKAQSANLQFSAGNFIKSEWITISISVITIIIGLFMIPTLVGWKPEYIPFVRPAFLPIGYMGTDILMKLFGVVSKRLNSAIDSKTTIADTTTGTLNTPTPADKITKP